MDGRGGTPDEQLLEMAAVALDDCAGATATMPFGRGRGGGVVWDCCCCICGGDGVAGIIITGSELFVESDSIKELMVGES